MLNEVALSRLFFIFVPQSAQNKYSIKTKLRSLIACLILAIVSTLPVYAQMILVHGKVVDQSGAPLSGVSITAKQDASKRTHSATDGTFSIQVAEKTVLVFALNGKKTAGLSRLSARQT